MIMVRCSKYVNERNDTMNRMMHFSILSVWHTVLVSCNSDVDRWPYSYYLQWEEHSIQIVSFILNIQILIILIPYWHTIYSQNDLFLCQDWVDPSTFDAPMFKSNRIVSILCLRKRAEIEIYQSIRYLLQWFLPEFMSLMMLKSTFLLILWILVTNQGDTLGFLLTDSLRYRVLGIDTSLLNI